MKNLDKDTLLHICEVLYSNGLGNCSEHRKGGQFVVYNLVKSLNEHGGYTFYWSDCEPCETETPHLPDQNECLVCGTVYEKTQQIT
tara:strand:+ start:376 stop:633 length:258 start_codon:yes stop_codon:yes gene_type:complete